MSAIDNQIYDRVHTTWWDEDGFMAILRKAVNPPRTAYFKKILTQKNLDLTQLRVLDLGCGGGLLAEQFSALGCKVTGVDQSLPSLTAAKNHAEKMQLEIEYQQGKVEHLTFPAQSFDVVLCCDVLEHVESVDAVIKEVARVLTPGGLFLFDTINRTFASKLFAIKVAQDWRVTRFIPRHVHVWEKFIRPHELTNSLLKLGFSQPSFTGLAGNPNPFPALFALLRRKLGIISYAELGEKMMLREARNVSIAYMGFAVKMLN